MRSIYFTLLLLSFSFSANAQISVGARIGLNIANQKAEFNNIESQQQPKNIRGLDLAVPIEISLSENFSIQPEIHFIQKGEQVETFDAQLEVTTIRSKYNYLEFPLLLKYDFSSGGGKLYAIGGAFLGYGLKGTEFITVGDLSEENEILFQDRFEPGFSRTFDRTDLGVKLGVGMEFLLNRGRIVTDVRYSTAFNAVREEMLLDDTLTLSNYGITISVGYMFDLGKTKKAKKKEINDGYEILK